MAPTFSAISIVTSDMAASLAFYRRLGVDVPDGAEAEPHAEAVLPAPGSAGGDPTAGLRLLWDTVDTVRTFAPDWTPPTGGPGVSLAFACADAGEVDRVYADLVRAGYPGRHEPWDAFWGQRYAVVQDPDGNSVDLFAPLPATA